MGSWDESHVTDTDRRRSRTSLDLPGLRAAATELRGSSINRFVDIGCGYGGLARLVGDYIDAIEVHGLDIDDRVAEECERKDVELAVQDADDGLPYPDDHFDAVMTLGMMDYLTFYDPLLREINRVLTPGGFVLVSLPNLASWHNRVQLIRGYQPRDIEISNEVMTGVAPTYVNAQPSGHIHIPTVKAIRELMAHHGFKEVALLPGQPQVRSTSNRALLWLDQLITNNFPTLARRFFYVGRQVAAVPVPEKSSSLPYHLLN